MAADVVGMVIGSFLVGRLGPVLRQRLLVPAAVGTGVPLLATFAGPGPAVTVALWALSGLLADYAVLAQIAFTQLVPDALRARAIGLASAGLRTAQGVGVLIAGVLAELMPASAAIAACAATGSLGALAVGAVCRLDKRQERREGDEPRTRLVLKPTENVGAPLEPTGAPEGREP
ncbi:MFS transporter [Glycomyces arizonensis]|uniref:MFS transporter n=1 Tax=Glycomyces arizonensis TaxID=256035 RepID=UPI001FE08C60|nr:MFS transporter [Glycomyces arizonensis]